MQATATLPDEEAFRADVTAGVFLLGSHRQRWRLGEVEWPFACIAISSVVRSGAPDEWWFRFDCSGYPAQAPTARPWDAATNAPLPFNRWPTGRARVPAVFRPDWKDGTCLYLPCDRVSAAGHNGWRLEHPSLMWSPPRGIVLYLEELHALLNSSDYTGARSA